MQFNYWESSDGQSIRLYVDGTSGDDAVYLHLLKRGRLVRVSHHGDWRAANDIAKELFSAGLDMSRQYNSIQELIDAISALPGYSVNTSKAKSKHSGTDKKAPAVKKVVHLPRRSTVSAKRAVFDDSGFGEHNSPRHFSDLSRETLGIELAKIPFKPGTKKSLRVLIDHREPDSIKDAFKQSGMNVAVGELKVGDIIIEDRESGDLMIIERKTILDFRQSIISKRAHSQAESMYDLEQSLKKQGLRVRCFWFIECMDNGMSYYDTLPMVKQTDGWECYTSAILGQHTVITLNAHHLVAKAIKFSQGFFDQELYYPVNIDGGARLDKTARERVKTEHATVDDESRSHGVSKNNRSLSQMLSLFPSINRKVAQTLAASGLSFREIINLDIFELMAFRGIGKTLAQKIYDDFSRCD